MNKVITPNSRRLITIAVMSATIMQVLDTTIVNVALPHMEGSLGTTPDQISWVLTSYLIASALFMPLAGYFNDTLGRKRYLLISIAGFLVASALCGLATDLFQMITFRLLQGVFGASLVPLSQSIMTDIYPLEERGRAMALWGVGIMVGPILGPTLGGYLTEIANWRWNFYINIPVGVISLLLAWFYVPDTPKKQRSMDWLGLVLIFVTIGSFQYFLDRGNRDDWFESYGIGLAVFLSIVGFLGYLLHSTRMKKNFIFDISIFKDRNFSLSCLLLAFFGLGLYGAMVILPMMLQNLFNYPVATTGLVMAPRGISSMISIYLVGKYIKIFDSRLIVALGILVTSIGMYLGTYYNLDISPAWVIGPILLQGFGLGMVFTPLAVIAYSTLKPSTRAEAAGMYSLVRSLGASIGISIVEMLFARHSQVNWNQLGAFLHPYNSAFGEYLKSISALTQGNSNFEIMQYELLNQSQMIAFVNIYAFITVTFLCMLPLCLLLTKQKLTKSKVNKRR